MSRRAPVALALSAALLAASAAAQAPVPPVAERRPHDVVSPHGTRNDPYYWLRDDTRKKPDVLAYLNAENAYFEAMSAPYRPLAEKLTEELRGRLDQSDTSVPYKYRDYVYYTRYEPGQQYPVYARKKVGSDAEQVCVDANVEAKGREYYAVGGRAISPNQNLLAFGEDVTGRRQNTIRVRDLATGRDLPDRIPGASYGLAWANDDKTLFYVENDPVTLLSTRVKKHVLGTDPKADTVVYEEKDTSFYLSVYKSTDDLYVMLNVRSTVASEQYVIDAKTPDAKPCSLAPRERDVHYDADHLGDRWILRTDWKAPNYRLMAVADSAIGDRARWTDLFPYDPDVMIEDYALFRDYLAINERANGLLRIRILPWKDPSKAFVIDADEPAYATSLAVNAEQDSNVVRYTYTSLVTPQSTYEADMRTGERRLLKRRPVLGGFDSANYASERVWATARDGVKVPVSLVYRKGFKRDGTAPLYQHAYGAYGASSDPYFDSTVFSLLDRGFVYALAHIRGGQEMGRAWYDAGHLLNKKNSFTDFIDVTAFLVREKYAAADKATASGASAGGLLMGAVLNMAPEKYRAIVAGVPYVDAVTTMMDESIPLVTNEFDEWGNPKDKKYYDYMLSYSPYDNVAAKNYPALLVTTGLNDSQVQYYEPAKWVAKLRATKTDKNPLLFKINMVAGHGGRSGRFESQKETAEEYAFLLHQVGIDR
jgi:oligopeptidase B